MSGVVQIAFLSLSIGIGTTLSATLIGLAIAALLVRYDFFGKLGILIFFRTMMGIPSVIVGLIFFLLLSRAGYFGFLELLYTPIAIVMAQTFLILPMIISFGYNIIARQRSALVDFLHVLPLSGLQKTLTYVYEARFSLLTLVLAAFGRAISEVGIVTLVGGNIENVTRVLTTAIILETQSGYFNQALILGMILILLVLLVNLIMTFLIYFLGESHR